MKKESTVVSYNTIKKYSGKIVEEVFENEKKFIAKRYLFIKLNTCLKK